MEKNSNNKGFTLIELLAVITVLLIIITIAFSSIFKYVDSAQKKVFLVEVNSVKKAAQDAVGMIKLKKYSDDNYLQVADEVYKFELENLVNAGLLKMDINNIGVGKKYDGWIEVDCLNDNYTILMRDDTYYVEATEFTEVMESDISKLYSSNSISVDEQILYTSDKSNQKTGKTIIQTIAGKAGGNSDGLSTNVIGDMYRYQGTTVNNYLCMGTSGCITEKSNNNTTDDNTYRIIGITEDGRIKVIKMSAVVQLVESSSSWISGTMKYVWATSSSYDWNKSFLRTKLNSTFLNSLNQEYSQKIDQSDSSKFYSTENSNNDVMYAKYSGTPDEIYTSETVKDNSTLGIFSASKDGYSVGLMQLSDYYYSVGDSTVNCYTNYCKASWLHITNNDQRVTEGCEWTMDRTSSTSAATISYSGMVSSSSIYTNYTSNYCIARPVFYLAKDTVLGGSGTGEDPYYIVTD